MEKPTLPKGTRDFGPAVMAKRQFIFNTIKGVFQKFGFQPLETPSMENLSTLTGKYGEEGDQLLFNVLESGDFYSETGLEVSKINYYLIQSIRTVIRELLGKNEGQYASVKYIKLEEALNPAILKDWLAQYYKTICKGRMVEGLDFTPNELNTILDLIEKRIDIFSNFVSRLLSDINGLDKSSGDLEFQLNYSLIENYNDFYQFIASLFNYKTVRRRFSEKGLRYDLTVPFARYVVMNRGEISFPFKRYQIQPVWRADRPQKGRYREFYQCDADVVGTDSLICEAEIILMIKDVFKGLGISDYSIKLNHRGVLFGLADLIGAKGNETSLFVGIDKLDKIGEEKVKEELRLKGFEENGLTTLFEVLNFNGSTEKKIDFLSKKFSTSTNGLKGIEDLKKVLDLLKSYGSNDDHVTFDIALARGLSYYTGCIFEVKINNVSIGSVSGGGRYDNLTQAFGDKENLSGVGFSFGVDRLYDAMEELKLFPKDTQVSSKVLICHFDEASQRYGLGVLTKLRVAGISSEIYPDQSKLKKQLDYANKKMIPFALVIGSEEIESGLLAFKDMEQGEQEKISINQIISKLSSSL